MNKKALEIATRDCELLQQDINDLHQWGQSAADGKLIELAYQAVGSALDSLEALA